MVLAIRLSRAGGPEVLVPETVQRSELGPNEAWIVQEAIGVNYLDVMQRQGTVPILVPGGIGLEGAGRVEGVGSAVRNVAVGDRVGYALGPLGAYASERAIATDRLIRLPDSLSFDEAAAVTFKGVTAQYLLKSTYPVAAGTVVLLYGVAGALGQLMVPWAKHLGAFVIGIVSKEASIETARSHGCDAVLVWGKSDLPREVAALNKGTKGRCRL
jgi:NADPH:quinone reductase